MTKPGSLGSQISPSALAPPGFEITSEELAALTPVDLINRLRRLIAMEPNLARHQGNLAVTLSLDNCSEDAAQTLERAVVLDVALARVHHNLAKVYSGLGRRTEALISLTRTLCLTPGDPDALEAWADAQTSRGDQQAIQAAFLRVIATAPDRADAWITRGLALAVLGRPVDTQRCLETAVQLRPNDPTFHSSVITTLDNLLDRPASEGQAARRRWCEQHTATLLPAILAHQNEPAPERRLRVGYASADFRNHSAVSVFAPVVLGHDPSLIELVLYSNSALKDEVTEKFKRRADLWRDVANLDDVALAQLVTEDRIDILVDLSGHSEGNRLLVFGRKPAPVQVTAWGYSMATGMPAIDYFLTDPIGVPHSVRNQFAETCVDLPCMVPFDLPKQPPPVVIPPNQRGDGITFGSFNRWSKVSPATLGSWARILQAVDGSRLLIKAATFDDARIRQSVARDFSALGISADRLEFRGRTSRYDHLASYGDIDIALDTFGHGGVTTWEALFMGVPVVSKLGEGVCNRVSATILHVIGYADWLAETATGYEALAIDAARSPDRLAALRSGLRERVSRSPGCDATSYTRPVEVAYRNMWRSWCAAQA
jgi:protein O-GlcNAc transferase